MDPAALLRSTCNTIRPTTVPLSGITFFQSITMHSAQVPAMFKKTQVGFLEDDVE